MSIQTSLLGGKLSLIIANIFPIKNLVDLKCKYKLYSIKGLVERSGEFEKNKEKLVKFLQFKTKSPCALLKRDDKLFIAQPLGYEDVPKEINLVRCQARLEELNEIFELDFGNLKSDEVRLAIRFLSFAISDPLFSDITLWQPGPGRPFFYKKPDREFNESSFEGSLHRGFVYRIIALPANKLGIMIDITSKYISKNYLPSNIDEPYFLKIKGHNCVHEFGDRWYEISLQGLEGLFADEFKLNDGSTIFEYAKRKIGTRTKQYSLLDQHGTVVSYYDNLQQPHYALSSLCRLTFDTNHPSVKHLHSKTQLSPKDRNNEIEKIIGIYFSNLKFNNSDIILDKPVGIEQKIGLPDLKFGNNVILSTNNAPNSIHSSIEEFGKSKMRMLTAATAGFIEKKKQLEKQFFVIPKTIANTCGNAFLEDLQEQFTEIYGKTTGISYKPTVIVYDDSGSYSIESIGNAIMQSVKSDFFRYGGLALVMIPRLENRDKEDHLASLVYREMRKRDIHCSIIHTIVAKRSYRKFNADDRGTYWNHVTDPQIRSKLRGYLFNVVLNKILLLNSCWPFMLESGLEADLTIGIDVKNHTAGFTFFYGDGTTPNFYPSVTHEREKLSYEHMKAKLIEFVRREQKLLSKNIKKIVIHRDGKLFTPEQKGILDAFAELAKEGLVEADYDCNLVEIPKKSNVPIRFFEISSNNNSDVNNPIVGAYKIFGNDVYLATTGKPYRFRGTSRPVHFIKKYGNMPLEKIVKDFFYLTNLTWTKIDDCSRLPITIKITDIRLREEAGEYEEDKYNFEKVTVESNE